MYRNLLSEGTPCGPSDHLLSLKALVFTSDGIGLGIVSGVSRARKSNIRVISRDIARRSRSQKNHKVSIFSSDSSETRLSQSEAEAEG